MEGADVVPIGPDETKVAAWGVTANDQPHTPIWIPRGKCGPDDVRFELLFCGICHSDVHIGGNDFGYTRYPFVAGHELCGRVVEVGANVQKVKVGDPVGVGCIVDSCQDCARCNEGEEQYCQKAMTGTYNGKRIHGHVPGNQALQTFGGYSAENVVHQRYIFKIHENIPLETAGPIFCAGITMYDPLRYHGATSGKKMKIGIVGIGGLGTMGIKLAAALGHDVIAISTSPHKEQMAKEKGATHFCVSTDPESCKQFAGQMDLIINTVSGGFDINTYLPLLKKDGVFNQCGATLEPIKFKNMQVIFGRRRLTGSKIGGCPATEELIELCGKHKIFPDVQVIEANQIDWAWKQLSGAGGAANKDGVRYVIDIKKSLQSDFVPK